MDIFLSNKQGKIASQFYIQKTIHFPLRFIPKGGGGYEDVGISKYVGGFAVCMKGLLIATKVCGQMTSNYTYFADIWFSSVKTAEEEMAAGVDYFRPVNTIHEGFCLATLKNFTKDWLGGSYLFIKITPRVPGGRPLLYIWYKYKYRKVL